MAVSPAEDILRTLKYNYKATTGKASYSQSTGIIVGPSTTGNINNKITCKYENKLAKEKRREERNARKNSK